MNQGTLSEVEVDLLIKIASFVNKVKLFLIFKVADMDQLSQGGQL